MTSIPNLTCLYVYLTLVYVTDISHLASTMTTHTASSKDVFPTLICHSQSGKHVKYSTKVQKSWHVINLSRPLHVVHSRHGGNVQEKINVITVQCSCDKWRATHPIEKKEGSQQQLKSRNTSKFPLQFDLQITWPNDQIFYIKMYCFFTVKPPTLTA